MKFTVMAISALVAAMTFAETEAPQKKITLAPGEFEARAKKNHERRTGGTVRKPGSAQGTALFLNAQSRVSLGAMKIAFKEIDENIHPMYKVVSVDSVNLLNPKKDIEKYGGAVGVAIVDASELPALVVAPEDGWAIVNVARLADGTDSSDVIANRTAKELLRAFALSCGCAFMSRTQIVLRDDVRSPKDLDSKSIEPSYGVEAQMTLERLLPTYGLMPWKQTTYKKACQEGWAPAPTNEYQKAIWDKIHSVPAKPMKIEFDPKKGR